MDFSKIIAQLKELNPVKELIEATIATHGENAERLAQRTEIEEATQALERCLPQSVHYRMRENPNYVYTPPPRNLTDPPPAVTVLELSEIKECERIHVSATSKLPSVIYKLPSVSLGLTKGKLIGVPIWRNPPPEQPPTTEDAVRVPNPKPKPTLPPATAEADLPVPEPKDDFSGQSPPIFGAG
jgi:hypothetical protein